MPDGPPAPPTPSSTTFKLSVLLVALVCVGAGLVGGCKLRFGTAGKDPFIHGQGVEGSPCTLGDDCSGSFACCAGRCAHCCSDLDCPTIDECSPSLCWDGTCRDDKPWTSPTFSGAIEAPSQPRTVICAGDLALLVLDRSIAIVDFTVADRPRFAGSQSFEGTLIEVEREGRLLAVLLRDPDDSSLRVHLVDLSLPSSPRVTVAATLDGLRTMTLDGTRLFTVSPNALWVVDVSSPEAPLTLSRTEIPCAAPVGADAGSGQMAIACGQQGVVIVDTSDPEVPVTLGSGLVEHATAVAGDGGTWAIEQPGAGVQLVATGADGTIGVTAPKQAGCLDTLQDFDGRILVTTDGQQLGIVDIQSGAHRTHPLQPRGSDTEAGRLLTLTGEGPQLRLELGALTAHLGIDTLASMDLSRFATVSDMAFNGSRAAVGFAQGGVMLLDVSQPGSPHVFHSMVHPGGVVSMTWSSDSEIAMVDDEGELLLMDFADPSAKPQLRSFDPADPSVQLLDVISRGSTLVVSDTASSVTLLAHQGIDSPERLDVQKLAAPSVFATSGDDTILVVSHDEKAERLAQFVELPTGGLSFGTIGDPFEVSATAVTTCADSLVDLLPGSDDTLRIRPIDGAGVTKEPTRVRAIGPVDAMTCAGDDIWTASPAGLLVFATDAAGTERITHTASPLNHGAAEVIEMETSAGFVAARSQGGVYLAETSLPPVGVIERVELGDSKEVPADVVTIAGRTVVARGREIVTTDGETLELSVGSPVVALDVIDGAVVAVTQGGQIAIVSVGPQGSIEQTSVIDVAQAGLRVDFTSQAACGVDPAGALLIVDLTDPALPVIGEPILPKEKVRDVTVVDLTCWLLLDKGRFAAVSLVDPGSPRLLEVTGDPEIGDPTRLWSAGGSLIAAQADTLIVVRLLPSELLELSHRIELPARVDDLHDAGGDLTIASGHSIWFISCVQDESSSRLLGSLDGDTSPTGLHVVDDSLLATGTDSLWALSLECVL